MKKYIIQYRLNGQRLQYYGRINPIIITASSAAHAILQALTDTYISGFIADSLEVIATEYE